MTRRRNPIKTKKSINQPTNQHVKSQRATTYDNGTTTAHPAPSTLHSTGTNRIEHTTIPTTTRNEQPIGNQNRLAIFGISLKKFDRSTSLTVADQVMLYEKRCARSACEMGMERPPKKKKLQGGDV
jgi:hypothetical protein